MTTEPQWTISLAPAAPEKERAHSSRPIDTTRPERPGAAAQLSTWLGSGYVAEMTDHDLQVLESSLTVLRATVSNNAPLWAAIPNNTWVGLAETLITEFEAHKVIAERHRSTAKSFIESFGISWSLDAGVALASAASLRDRYAEASFEIAELVTLLRTGVGIDEPSLEDVAFLSGLLPSLKGVDPRVLGLVSPSSTDLTAAAEARAAMIRLSDDMKNDFQFEPILHGEHALGGVRRAFATKKAPDFVSAARKLGAVVSGAEQAQKAAKLMKEYLAADEAFSLIAQQQIEAGGVTTSLRQARSSLVERIQLVRSIARRRAVLVFNEAGLSPKLLELGVEPLDSSLFDSQAGMNADTRKLVEDNITAVGSKAKAEGFARHIQEVSQKLAGWITRTAEAHERSGAAEINLDGLDTFASKHPALVTSTELGYSISTQEEADEVARHILWLREASMLPLSDEKLATYLERRGQDQL